MKHLTRRRSLIVLALLLLLLIVVLLLCPLIGQTRLDWGRALDLRNPMHTNTSAFILFRLRLPRLRGGHGKIRRPRSTKSVGSVRV